MMILAATPLEALLTFLAACVLLFVVAFSIAGICNFCASKKAAKEAAKLKGKP